MAIDIGPEASNRATFNSTTSRTFIMLDNPANASGTIDTIQIYVVSGYTASGVKVGTFYGSGTTYTCRDYVTIGDIASGGLKTFSDLSISVESGDYIGYIATSGRIEFDETGFAGMYQYKGDAFGGGETVYSLLEGCAVSIYGTGTESSAGLSIPIVQSIYRRRR
jgi:hypothetical protein